jgi:hypothetical protein
MHVHRPRRPVGQHPAEAVEGAAYPRVVGTTAASSMTRACSRRETKEEQFGREDVDSLLGDQRKVRHQETNTATVRAGTVKVPLAVSYRAVRTTGSLPFA